LKIKNPFFPRGWADRGWADRGWADRGWADLTKKIVLYPQENS